MLTWGYVCVDNDDLPSSSRVCTPIRDWIDCDPSVDMNDDEYMCLDMYGLPAEYEELLVVTACWPAACEPDDLSEECDAPAPQPGTDDEVSVSIDCTESVQRSTVSVKPSHTYKHSYAPNPSKLKKKSHYKCTILIYSPWKNFPLCHTNLK